MLKCYMQLEKFGGKKNWRSRRLLSRSFVKAFLNNIYVGASQLNSNTLNTSNVSTAIQLPSTNTLLLFCNVGGGGSARWFSGNTGSVFDDYKNVGIVVGTGNAAVTPTDYALATKVDHGTSSGKLEYFGNGISAVTVSAPNASFDIERIFRNSSGAGIVISEIGLQAESTISGVDTDHTFLYIRDVISPTVTVANGEYLKVKYTIQVTV